MRKHFLNCAKSVSCQSILQGVGQEQTHSVFLPACSGCHSHNTRVQEWIVQNRETCQVPSKLSSTGRTGQSWGCVVHKNLSWAEQSCIHNLWEECHSHQPGLPALLIAKNKVQGPFLSCSVPNWMCLYQISCWTQQFPTFPVRRAECLTNLHYVFYAISIEGEHTTDTILFSACNHLPSLLVVKQELEVTHLFLSTVLAVSETSCIFPYQGWLKVNC